MIGEIGFVGPPVNGAVTIGYAIVPSARGQGYATEAIAALTRRGRSRSPRWTRCARETLPDNEPSIRALLRAGFAETRARTRSCAASAQRGLSATSRPPSAS